MAPRYGTRALCATQRCTGDVTFPPVPVRAASRLCYQEGILLRDGDSPVSTSLFAWPWWEGTQFDPRHSEGDLLMPLAPRRTFVLAFCVKPSCGCVIYDVPYLL